MPYPASIMIQVAQADLKGATSSILDCPLVRAVKPHFPGHAVTAGVCGVHLFCAEANWSSAWYELPEVAHDFMNQFDHADEKERHLLRPISFVMTLTRHTTGRPNIIRS